MLQRIVAPGDWCALDRQTFVDEWTEYNTGSEARRNGQVFHFFVKEKLASCRGI
jgi:hypothetical protein